MNMYKYHIISQLIVDMSNDFESHIAETPLFGDLIFFHSVPLSVLSLISNGVNNGLQGRVLQDQLAL